MTTDASDTTGETLVSTFGDRMQGDGIPARRLLQRGDTIGRYVVLEAIGTGGMGMVYAAYDPELDRRVAIKLVRPGRRSDPDVSRTRLLREAQAMAKLNHRNVITVHDVGDFEGQVFVAMEYVEGKTLKAWRKDEQPDWRRVVSVMADAGRGLAAAHAAGLIHRDFKPDNVMVADDGRVLVMDFGLVRAAVHEEEPSRPPLEQPSVSGSGSSADLSTTVTRDGALVGTPAYMAPEQHVGLPTDARTDQFSFGIALHETLYGTHPFGGTTMAAIANAVTDGDIRPAPRNSDVPAWVRRIVLRTLEVKAADRYPSMDAVIAELSRNPSGTLRQTIIGIAVAALVIAGLVGVRQLSKHEPTATCTGGEEHAGRVWNDELAAEVRSAFRATEVGYAQQTAERVDQSLNDRMRRWSSQHRSACLAGRAGEHSDHVLDLRMACLRRNLDQVEALVHVLEQADAEIVARAADAVDGLPLPEQCGDVNALLDTAVDPPPAEVAAEVAELQARIPKVRALYLTGKPKRARDLAEPLVEQCEATGYGPLIADALNLLGHLQIDVAQYAEAEKTLERAVFTSMSHGAPTTGDAGVRLAWVVGMPLQRPEEGLRWARLVRAELDRSDAPDPWVEVRLLKNMGEIQQRDGRHEVALANARQAVEIAEREFDDDHPAVFGTKQTLGALLVEQGQASEGQEILRQALELRERAVGADHPSLGTLHNNLGAAAEKQGEFGVALEHLQRAHELKLATYGPDHPTIGFSENNLSATLIRLDRHEEAIVRGRRALAIWEPTFGADHVTIAYALANIGRAHLELGEIDEAKAALARALDIATAKEGSPDLTGEIRFALARTIVDAEPARAETLAREALADFEGLGPDGATELEEVRAWLTKSL